MAIPKRNYKKLYVNARTSNLERRFKWQLLRIFGLDRSRTKLMASWLWNHIKLFLRSNGYTIPNKTKRRRRI